MSSIRVRDLVFGFLAANSSEKFVDFTGEFEELSTLLQANEIGPEDVWVGIDFVGNEETSITLPATNTEGTYRETGAIYVHVVGVAGLGMARSTLIRAETLRDLFRSQRLGTLSVDSVSPANTGTGTTLNLEGGYFSASFIVSYENDYIIE